MRKQSKRSKQSKQKKQKTVPKKKPVTKTRSKSRKIQQPQIDNEEKVEQKIQQIAPAYTVEKIGDKFKVNLHKSYEVEMESQIGKKIHNFVTLLSKKQGLKCVHFTYYPTFQFSLAGEKPEDEKCSICQFEYESLSLEQMQKQITEHHNSDIIILKCSHMMHFECLKQLIKDQKWIKCPVCSTIYGKMIGDQPAGTMTYNVNNSTHCDGFPDCGTIVINYNMHAGKKGNISFPGTHRAAYLPDNKEGNQVLELLKQAFQRKLIFTIGRSVTTGRDNQIVWNGIHHKTNISGGSAYFGYPDATYFDRVKLELAAKGVV